MDTFRLQKRQMVILFALIALLIMVTAAWPTFNYPPRSVHQWRQSDCAAYVKTYYRTGSNLWHPATYNLVGNEGRVISEFPLIYYVAAKLQHSLGEHYWVVRGLTFAFYVLGLVALTLCINRWIPNRMWALLPVLLLASSPYYFYYAINFLPNIPAIIL